jgi:hypothetical protein
MNKYLKFSDDAQCTSMNMLKYGIVFYIILYAISFLGGAFFGIIIRMLGGLPGPVSTLLIENISVFPSIYIILRIFYRKNHRFLLKKEYQKLVIYSILFSCVFGLCSVTFNFVILSGVSFTDFLGMLSNPYMLIGIVIQFLILSFSIWIGYIIFTKTILRKIVEQKIINP